MIVHTSIPSEIERRRIVDVNAAASFLGLTEQALRSMRQRKSLPEAIKLSTRRIGFRLGDLMDFVDCRAAGREWKDCRGASGQTKAV